MTSQLAKEDIEALIDEGCVVHPSDVIRLNALGLKLEKRPDFRLATLPRVALCGGVLFQQPTIGQDIFLDELCQVFNQDEGTILALEAYVLAHPNDDWENLPTFPRMFALKCIKWIRKHLKNETAEKVRHAIDFCKFGMNPEDGEFPVYVTDETFDKWYGEAGPLSIALKKYVQACAYGIASDTALRATSPKLTAMIECAGILNDLKIDDDEKQATAEYYKLLEVIKIKARAERDAKKKNDEVKNG
jgi:hypothetical protein